MKMYKRWQVQEHIAAHILEIDLSFESNEIRVPFHQLHTGVKSYNYCREL